MSVFGAGGTSGLALGPVVVLATISAHGIAATPWLMLPGIVLAPVLYVVRGTRGGARTTIPRRSFDSRLLRGPVGVLSADTILLSVPAVTFTSAAPLWLVAEQGVARDAAVIGWTLAAYNVAAAVGGIVAGALSARIRRHALVAGTMLAALAPLYAVFWLAPGTVPYFLAVVLAGGLVHAGLPVLVVSAQDLAPHAVATASGMIGGFAVGMGGMLYIGVGRLQELIGLTAAMSVSYLALIPGALLAMVVLARHRPATGQTAARTGCACPPPCACGPCPALLAA